MVEKIKKAFLNSEKIRFEFMDTISSSSGEQQNFHPEENAWSMREVAWHLAIAERQILRYLQKRPLKKASVFDKAKTHVRSFLLSRFMRSERKVSAPKFTQPENVPAWEEIQSHWQQTRTELEGYLSGYTNDQLSDIVFKHPRAGEINITQTIGFLSDHIHHHQRQLRRIKENSGFPTT